MTAWRVIVTDTESMTGVAPVCEDEKHAEHVRTEGMDEGAGGAWVFDCCPYPQIETWDENFADELAARLTEHGAEVAGT